MPGDQAGLSPDRYRAAFFLLLYVNLVVKLPKAFVVPSRPKNPYSGLCSASLGCTSKVSTGR